MNTDQAQLRTVLSRADHHETVKMLIDGRWDKVTIEQARVLVLRGEYSWAGTKRRVKQISLVALYVQPMPVREAVWEPCLRTTACPTIQPSIEWLRNLYGCPQEVLAA